MKILIVSNLYPPHYLGGYEIRCAQVAEALHREGHAVEVITSVYKVPGGTRPSRRLQREVRRGVGVHRCLREYIFPERIQLRPWAFFQARRELEDVRHFLRIARAFKPDVVNWWSLYGVSMLMLPLPGRLGIPDISWIEQSWMIDRYGPGGDLAKRVWQEFWEGRWGIGKGNALTRAIGRRWEEHAIRDGIETRNFSAPPRHVCFVSEFISDLHRRAGVVFPSSEVIHGGVSTEQFLASPRTEHQGEPLRLLYAGQLTPDRGLHTVIEALSLLTPPLRERVTLLVAGDGQEAYRKGIESRLVSSGLTGRVKFAGRVAHNEMPALYRGQDVLVFPSARDEGLPLSMIEAMLSGCAVLTTGAGGASEIAALAELPTFAPGNAPELAGLISGLVQDRAEVTRVAARGQEVAVREFSFDRMFSRFTTTLRRVVEGTAP